MEIVGLSGYARTGKDEFAAVLVEEYDFIRVAFADKLREVIYALNPIVLWDNDYAKSDSVPDYMPLQWVINEYTWDNYKATGWGKHIRVYLQRLGTEAGRETLWDSIWVDAAFANLPEDARVVVTDMRFPNEADAVRDRGGLTVRIHRDGVGPVNDHPSETSLDDYAFDYHVDNDGTLEEYKEMIRKSGFV
jgi:hypothetical protein